MIDADQRRSTQQSSTEFSKHGCYAQQHRVMRLGFPCDRCSFYIKYKYFKNKYEIHGVTYKNANSLVEYSNWKSEWINFTDNTIEYIYEGAIIGHDPIKGYANYTILLPGGGANIEGQGYIIDLCKPPSRYDISVYRIDKKEQSALLGGLSVDQHEGRIEFLTSYFQKHPERIKVIPP